MDPLSHKVRLGRILNRMDPGEIVYAPNYWQWFTHHQHHHTLPPEFQSCQSQLDLIDHLGLAVFSRNIYCDQEAGWFGGFTKEEYDGCSVQLQTTKEGKDALTTRRIQTPTGPLVERQRYIWAESTVVQEEFLVDSYTTQRETFEQWVKSRSWHFNSAAYQAEQKRVGDRGLVIAGELVSPLKMLHLVLGPVNTTYLAVDFPDFTAHICSLHEKAQLDLVKQMVRAQVQVMMAMDNLDSVFHPPAYVEQFSASFYRQAAAICHEEGSHFFIHACGNQAVNLARISELGVDGLEGVAYPPLGDVSLVEAMQATGDRFLITGGISATEFERLKTRDQVFNYVQALFKQMKPFRHRFVFSASCNTPINASYEQMIWFRDAWKTFKGL